MKCAPTFGAIPSTADLKKKEEAAAEEADKRNDALSAMLSKEALARLGDIEDSNSSKAERLKTTLLSMSGQYSKENPMSEAKLKELAEAAATSENVVVTTKGLVLDRRRFGDDDDSDIDLDGL